MQDSGFDPLGRLAASLGRPRASLAAYISLTAEQLTLLTDSIEATAERRRREVDEALRRAFPEPLAPALTLLLRREGSGSLRRRLIRRSA